MLEDDVASNRAIGSYGASCIQQQTGKQKLSVLTHCNTGRCLLQYHSLFSVVLHIIEFICCFPFV